MNRQERLQTHRACVPGGMKLTSYMPHPQSHMHNYRDRAHAEWVLRELKTYSCESILDVGTWDGWLPLYMHDHMPKGFRSAGVELVPELADAASRYAALYGKLHTSYCGFFDEVSLNGDQWDIVSACEVLEHIPLSEVPYYVGKMEARAKKVVLVSLPDQPREENREHLWTPSGTIIRDLWGDRKGFACQYLRYPEAKIPASFMISWEIA